MSKDNKSDKINPKNVSPQLMRLLRIKPYLFLGIAIATVIYFFNRGGNPMVNNMLAFFAFLCTAGVTIINAKENVAKRK